MIIPKQRLQELRRIRIVTKNYGVLRGLQGIPFGLLLLLMAAVELKRLHLNVDLAQFFGFTWFFIALIIYPIIGRYYDRMFGRVEQTTATPSVKWIIGLSFAVLAVGAISLDKIYVLPISATGLVLALTLLFLWWQTNAFRTHLLVLALLTAFLSIAPLIGFTAFHALFLPGHGGYELVFGVMMTIGGLCDHLLLLRAFRQTQRVYQS